ncbi:MAG: hypothetical protein U0166_14320 [Acidobacteriota bacterium]
MTLDLEHDLRYHAGERHIADGHRAPLPVEHLVRDRSSEPNGGTVDTENEVAFRINLDGGVWRERES